MPLEALQPHSTCCATQSNPSQTRPSDKKKLEAACYQRRLAAVTRRGSLHAALSCHQQQASHEPLVCVRLPQHLEPTGQHLAQIAGF